MSNSYTDWLKRSFYAHLAVLDRIGRCDIFHIGSDNHFPEKFTFPFSEEDRTDAFLEWLKNHITIDDELGKMFPKLLASVLREMPIIS